jgi:hypothetical protein
VKKGCPPAGLLPQVTQAVVIFFSGQGKKKQVTRKENTWSQIGNGLVETIKA